MAIITEDYVSFEVAKLLKEKEFNEKVICYYDDGGSLNLNKFVEFQCCNQGYGSGIFAAPTLQMTIKWLREVHNLYIQPKITTWPQKGYFVKIYLYRNCYNDFEEMPFIKFEESYEEACEVAIKYCLENLI